MGPAQEDNGSLPRPMPQISAVVYPTRTVYTFRTDEVQLVVTFLTPYLPQDLNTLQPITYLTFQVSINQDSKRICYSIREGFFSGR